MTNGEAAATRPTTSAVMRPDANTELSGFYRSRDGHWFVLNPRGASNDWQVLCQTFERPDLPLDPRFATGKVRRQNSVALVEQLDATFGALDYAEIIRRLDAADQL